MTNSVILYYLRRGSTPVSTNLRKSLSFFIINIFSNTSKKFSKLKSGKWFGLALHHIHCNIEIDVDKIIHRFAKVSSAREEWNWLISCLNDSEPTRKGSLGS